MIDWPDAATQGSLYAAGINVVLLGALLLTRRWWSLRGFGPQSERLAGAPSENGDVACFNNRMATRKFWLALAVILLVAVVVRVPLARSSLWWDEVWQARHASIGEWRPDKKNPGTMKFRETSFAQALWNYRKPANHPPMAVTSKACHEVWRVVTGAKPGELNEFVLRLPGFIASLAGLVLIALLLRAWGMPGAGLVAAGFLALHPWHIRYGIDGRGYTFLVPLALIGLWSLWRACGPRTAAFQAASGENMPAMTDSEALDGGSSPDSTGGQKRSAAFQAASETESDPGPITTLGQGGHSTAGAWWLFGFTQALILWSHLLSVWVCLALCATGVWWIWRQHTGAERWRRLARLAAVQVAGAMVFFQLFLPNLWQATQWGEKNQDGRLLDGLVLVDTLTQVAVGGPRWGAALLVFALAVCGLALARKGRLPGTAGGVALFVGAAVFLFGVWAVGFYFYPRFVFAGVVPLALGVALYGEALARWPHRPGSTAPWADPRCFVFFIMSVTLAVGLRPVLQGGFSPLREAATVLRNAEASGAHVFGYGFGAEALQYYLPTLPYAREADAPEALATALENARAAGKPLLVAVGYEELNRIALPAGFALLDDASRCTEIWKQSGLEPQFAYRIRRFDPPPAP